MLDGLKQYERGQELLTRANDIAVCAWGPGSMQHLNVLYALAQHFRRRNMIQESIDFHEQASAVCVVTGGKQLHCKGPLALLHSACSSFRKLRVVRSLRSNLPLWPVQPPFHPHYQPTHSSSPTPLAPLPKTNPQVLAIMDESIQVYSPELLQNRIAILR